MGEHHQARLLLAAVQQRWDEYDRLAAHEPPAPEPFLRLAREADVLPWLHARLAESGRLARTGPIDQALARARQKVRHDNLLLVARAETALDLLLGARVVPVALKGLDALHRLYPQFDLRTVDDVDLLLRFEQLEPALAALEGAGWRVASDAARTHFVRSSHHLPLTAPGPIPVELELHWSLAQEQRFHVDPAGLIARALPLDVGGRSVLRLEDHDAATHLLLHHFTHYFDRRLKWLLDLVALAGQPGFDWERVVGRAREWGAAAACGFALVHL
ncbi:MAG TPA: nucleotidyltransferase family protein, partial [Candidatus Polarisedimenticolaceae bacterium]|nr:nucleotidyltransferase family protein [Candidatus Polarisedimenticolaceae bacterium]